MRDFIRRAREGLDPLGLDIEIRDSEELSDMILDMKEEEGILILRPDDDGGEFRIDLDDPFSEDGFRPQSLFLYVNGIDAIERWMREGFDGSPSAPDAEEAEWLLRRVAEARGNPEFLGGFRRKAIQDGIGFDIDDPEGSLRGMLGRTDFAWRDRAGKSHGICARDLFEAHGPENGCAAAGKKIRALFAAAGGEEGEFERRRTEAEKALSRWIKNFDETVGGELLAAREAKRSFADAYGGETPFTGRIYRASGRFVPHDPEDGDGLVRFGGRDGLLIVMHRDSFDEDECAKATRDIADALNGDVHEFLITRDGDVVAESPAFVGADPRASGMADEFEATLDILARERKAPRPRR